MREGTSLGLLSMTWFRWLGITLISFQHLPRPHLLPLLFPKSLPSVSSNFPSDCFSLLTSKLSPFQARLIVFICTTVVAPPHPCDEAALMPIVITPDRYSFVNKLTDSYFRRHRGKSQQGERTNRGMATEWSAAIWSADRIHTGLGASVLQF